MNSLTLLVIALCFFALAYRVYGAFLAAKVAVLDTNRTTPAHRYRDGKDYHPTNKWVTILLWPKRPTPGLGPSGDLMRLAEGTEIAD